MNIFRDFNNFGGFRSFMTWGLQTKDDQKAEPKLHRTPMSKKNNRQSFKVRKSVFTLGQHC